MSKEYEIEVIAQPSLYKPKDRTLRIYFSEPDAGIHENTGILLLISGYGGQANSNVYKKMRSQFADTYNMVTVQCNYFGWEYMQSNTDIRITGDMLEKTLTEEEKKLLLTDFNTNKHIFREKTIDINMQLNETLENMNDMGPVQAIDQLTALKVVTDIILQNGLVFNKKKIVLYGFSHGGYISYLCNALMPGVVTTIIDNSAYVFPSNLNYNRTLMWQEEAGYNVCIIYDYLIKNIVFDKDIYDLNYLYERQNSNVKVISFHGLNDTMAPIKDKLVFLEKISNSICEVIDENRIDGDMFNSTKHGLGADFLKLYDYAERKYGSESEREGLQFGSHIIETEKCKYFICFDDEIPLLKYEMKR